MNDLNAPMFFACIAPDNNFRVVSTDPSVAEAAMHMEVFRSGKAGIVETVDEVMPGVYRLGPDSLVHGRHESRMRRRRVADLSRKLERSEWKRLRLTSPLALRNLRKSQSA